MAIAKKYRPETAQQRIAHNHDQELNQQKDVRRLELLLVVVFLTVAFVAAGIFMGRMVDRARAAAWTANASMVRTGLQCALLQQQNSLTRGKEGELTFVLTNAPGGMCDENGAALLNALQPLLAVGGVSRYYAPNVQSGLETTVNAAQSRLQAGQEADVSQWVYTVVQTGDRLTIQYWHSEEAWRASPQSPDCTYEARGKADETLAFADGDWLEIP